MKRVASVIAAVTLMLNSGVVISYAQQRPLNMTVSGTAAPSTVDLGTGTFTSEYNLAGNGSFGSFSFRTVSSSAASPELSSSCSGPATLYFSTVAGMGVFRSADGSLLEVTLTGGGDCIDFSAGKAFCTRIYEITGGTGRFQNASASGGTVTLSMTVAPVVPGKPFFTVTGEITGAEQP